LNRKRLLLLVLLVALGLAACFQEKRIPFVFEIPKDFRGWVSVEFFRRDCPPLPPPANGKQVVRLPDNGRLCVGSPIPFGEGKDEYYFVDGDQRAMADDQILAEHVALEAGGSGKRAFERFFVGTKEELGNSSEPKGQ
jgi:hypothetical protein